MNPVVIIVAAMLILGLIPLFVVFGISCKDLKESRQESKRIEKEIHEMIYGKKKC